MESKILREMLDLIIYRQDFLMIMTMPSLKRVDTKKP
jgi:hypothetical protein